MAKKLLHGKRCTWVLKGDFVVDRKRGRVASFDRLWECDDCRLERRRLYTLIPYATRGPLRYKGKHVPLDERISDEAAIIEELKDTTNDEVKVTLRALGEKA
jgi:hypothetical protein